MTAHLTQDGGNVVFNDQGVMIIFVDTVIADINPDMARLINVMVKEKFAYKQFSEMGGSSEVDDSIEMIEVVTLSENVQQMYTVGEVFSEIFEEKERSSIMIM